MKFFIDENLPHVLAQPLSSVYRKHKFDTAQHTMLRSIDDQDLFIDLDDRGFDAIITLDRQQLVHHDERDGLAHAGLHWIGVPPVRAKGLALLASVTSIVIGGLHHVLDDWQDKPHLYRLRAPGDVSPDIEPL